MKFQDSSLNGLKVTVCTKSVTHAPTNGRSKSNMPHQLFKSWGHYQNGIFIGKLLYTVSTKYSVDRLFCSSVHLMGS